MLLPVLAVTVFCVFSWAAEPPGGYYTTRYDHLDVENILNQKRLVQHYAKCLTNKGPCPPQGLEFKRIVPEAIKTNCLRCTEKQRYVLVKSLKRLRKEYPKVWTELAAAWDPSGQYVAILENSMPTKPSPKPTVATAPPFTFDNRFGDSEQPEQSNTIPSTTKTTTSTTTKQPSQATYVPPKTTQKPVYLPPKTTLPPPRPTRRPSPSFVVNNNILPTAEPSMTVTQKTSTYYNPFIFNPNRPVQTVSVNAAALITEPLRKLSSLGSHVVKTGARIADMFVANLQTVLGR